MVILLGLIFLLDRPTQDQTIKISFIFFRALFQLICIYKVQANFWNCLNRLEKGFNLPGHVSPPESTRGVSRCGLSGHVAHSEGTRQGSLGLATRATLRTRRVPGGWLASLAVRTRA